MNDREDLSDAEDAVRAGRVLDAMPVLERLIDNDSEEKAEAAYCLGLIFEIGHEVATNVQKAEEYYLMAEAEGCRLATYRLAALFLRAGDHAAAMTRFRLAAPDNPSAAYWAYRCLQQDARLELFNGEASHYLNLAIELGHVHAKRIAIVQKIRGQQGLLRIPVALVQYVLLLKEAGAAVMNKERLRYK